MQNPRAADGLPPSIALIARLRGFYLRACQLQGFMKRIERRRWMAKELISWADKSQVGHPLTRHFEVAYQTWWLAENLRGFYEIMAERLDISSEAIRRSVQQRVAS